MGTAFVVSMGDRGRLVVPAELRARQHWEQGTALLMIETDSGAVLTSREQALALVGRQLGDADLVGELIEERRAAARQEDA